MAPRVQKCVNHFRRFRQINLAILHRQAHEAEAKVLFEMFHIRAPFFLFCFYFNGSEGFHQAPFVRKTAAPGHGAAVCCYIMVLYRNSGNPFGRLDAEI